MTKLKHLLIDKKVEQKELAEAAGCSPQYISRCINGRDNMSPRVLDAICEHLKVNKEEIL